jgi:hypothetical protein
MLHAKMRRLGVVLFLVGALVGACSKPRETPAPEATKEGSTPTEGSAAKEGGSAPAEESMPNEEGSTAKEEEPKPDPAAEEARKQEEARKLQQEQDEQALAKLPSELGEDMFPLKVGLGELYISQGLTRDVARAALRKYAQREPLIDTPTQVQFLLPVVEGSPGLLVAFDFGPDGELLKVLLSAQKAEENPVGQVLKAWLTEKHGAAKLDKGRGNAQAWAFGPWRLYHYDGPIEDSPPAYLFEILTPGAEKKLAAPPKPAEPSPGAPAEVAPPAEQGAPAQR